MSPSRGGCRTTQDANSTGRCQRTETRAQVKVHILSRRLTRRRCRILFASRGTQRSSPIPILFRASSDEGLDSDTMEWSDLAFSEEDGPMRTLAGAERTQPSVLADRERRRNCIYRPRACAVSLIGGDHVDPRSLRANRDEPSALHERIRNSNASNPSALLRMMARVLGWQMWSIELLIETSHCPSTVTSLTVSHRDLFNCGKLTDACDTCTDIRTSQRTHGLDTNPSHVLSRESEIGSGVRTHENCDISSRIHRCRARSLPVSRHVGDRDISVEGIECRSSRQKRCLFTTATVCRGRCSTQR